MAYWNASRECMSRDELRHLQDERLVKVVKEVYHNVPFYRERMQKQGIEPGDIHGVDDLHLLPFTTKDDLRDTYPFGLFAKPMSEIVRVHGKTTDFHVVKMKATSCSAALHCSTGKNCSCQELLCMLTESPLDSA